MRVNQLVRPASLWCVALSLALTMENNNVDCPSDRDFIRFNEEFRRRCSAGNRSRLQDPPRHQGGLDTGTDRQGGTEQGKRIPRPHEGYIRREELTDSIHMGALLG